MTAVEAQWNPVKHLILGEDPQLRLYAEVSIWIKKIEMLRKGEDARMIGHTPTADDLAVHKTLLQRLIADGQHLLTLIRQFGLPENVEAVTVDSVSATLGLLQADYRGWHEPKSEEERQQILREAFPNVA